MLVLRLYKVFSTRTNSIDSSNIVILIFVYVSWMMVGTSVEPACYTLQTGPFKGTEKHRVPGPG